MTLCSSEILPRFDACMSNTGNISPKNRASTMRAIVAVGRETGEGSFGNKIFPEPVTRREVFQALRVARCFQ